MDSRRPDYDEGIGDLPDQRISSLIEAYFDRRRAGETLTPEEFLAEHPDDAELLRPYLGGMGIIEQARVLASHASEQQPMAAGNLPAPEGYELLEEIGRGGMGVVYKALQISTKRNVALKVMLGGPFASPTARKRFEREIELAARLQHPYIVRVLESGSVAGQQYYAMDFVRGTRLDLYLRSRQLRTPELLALVLKICEAVEYAHRTGVIHRDLKPANVLIDDDGNPHVLDFGLAKRTELDEEGSDLITSVSLPGQVVGTLSYLSPEQAVGNSVAIGARTDVYALGVVLFEILTGKLPIDSSGRPSEVIQRILEIPPKSPASLSDGVDAELETIILKALEKELERRYQSIRELAEDIKRYLDGEPIHARRSSSLYVLCKKVRKHRVGVVIAAVVATGIFVSLLVERWSARQDRIVARHRILQYQQTLESGRGNDVDAEIKALYQRHPDIPEMLLVWAQVRYRDGHCDAAIRSLETKLRRDPTAWTARALLAEIYRSTGDLERAELLLSQAIREAPDTAEAWYLRSFATLAIEQALDCVETAVDRDPGHTLAWRRLIQLRLTTDDLVGVLSGIDKLIEMGDDVADWIMLKAHVYARRGDFREAIEQYTHLMSLNPNQAGPYVYRALAYRRVKEYESAVHDYTQALELDGEVTANVWYYYQRAAPLWMLGRREEALADYRHVRITLGRPFFSDARWYLILRELDRDQEAQQVISAALCDVEPRYPWLRQVFRYLAGELTGEELINNASAMKNREQLCEAYYYVGELARLDRRVDEARELFELCVATGVEFDLDAFPVTPMNEYELALWRLDTLP